MTTPRCSLCDAKITAGTMCKKCSKEWAQDGTTRRLGLAIEAKWDAGRPSQTEVEGIFGDRPERLEPFDDAKQTQADTYDAIFNASRYADQLDEAGDVTEFGAAYFLDDASFVLITPEGKIYHYASILNPDA